MPINPSIDLVDIEVGEPDRTPVVIAGLHEAFEDSSEDVVLEKTLLDRKAFYAKFEPPAQSFPFNSFYNALSLQRELWVVATDREIVNKKPDVNYAYAGRLMVDRCERVAKSNPGVGKRLFADMLRILAEISYWRGKGDRRTVVALLPPPIDYVSAWERSFGNLMIDVAWVDENGIARKPSDNDAIFVSKAMSKYIHSEHSPEFIEIAELRPGQTARFKIPHGATPIERRRITAKFNNMAKSVSKKFGDRIYFVPRPKRHHRMISVTRYSQTAYDMIVASGDGPALVRIDDSQQEEAHA